MTKNVGNLETKPAWLTGQLLVAMPSMLDPRFERTLLLMCSHSPDGAMGLVINRLFGELSFQGLLDQFGVKLDSDGLDKPVYYGGPVEPIRGFVLHSSDYKEDGTTCVLPSVHLTATVDILRALAQGQGPKHALLLLGYAGWAPGQLESEIQSNGWLTVPADDDIIFDPHHADKWERAMAKIGVSPSVLSSDVGHA